MKNFILFLALVIIPSVVMAEEAEKHTLSVSGEAEVKVIPDEIIINMNTETKDESLTKTKSLNDQIVKDVVAYAKSINISEKDIKTDYVNVRPQYKTCGYKISLTRCDPSEILYYTANQGIQIKLKDFSNYEKLMTRVMELGVKYINDIQFTTSELRKHRDKARELASKAAIEKANDIAKVFGVKVKKPISIVVNQPYSAYGGYYNRGRNIMSQNVMVNAGGGGSNAPALSLGQISIKANVNVVFELE